MFHTILILAFIIAGWMLEQGEHSVVQQSERDSTATLVTFQQHIAPLLKTNCSPCHFEGGQVYGRYPFDDIWTVKALGEKLNTRLKELEQKALVVNWLKSGAKEK